MRLYGFFEAFFLSFFSKDLYRDVAQRWGGRAFVYLLLLLAIVWIPLTYKMQRGINQFYATKSEKYVNQVPVLTFTNGKISTPQHRPYFLIDPDTNQRWGVIDTSGEYTNLQDAQAQILITETNITYQANKNETRFYQVPSNLNLVLDPQATNNYVKQFVGFSWIFLYLICLFGSYLYRLIQAIIYAVIGKIVTNVKRIPLRYSQVLSIAMVAITPVIILSTVFEMFEISFMFINLFYFVLAMFYLVFGISANRN